MKQDKKNKFKVFLNDMLRSPKLFAFMSRRRLIGWDRKKRE